MDVASLAGTLQYVSVLGHTLSLEQRSVLAVAIPTLQSSLHLKSLHFWGKISGLSKDYFIAQGKETDDVFGQTKTFLSTNCAQWALLPEVNPAFTTAVKEAILDIRSPFTGGLSNVVSINNPEFVQDNGTNELSTIQRERTLKVTEEQRIALFVEKVDFHCSLAPRGAFVLTPRKAVEVNTFFTGLSEESAQLLASYVHMRDAVRLKNKSLLEREELGKSLDFLDAASDDTPHGSWSLRRDAITGAVTVRCNRFPGALHFHVPGTALYGNVYFGRGLRDPDFGFRTTVQPQA